MNLNAFPVPLINLMTLYYGLKNHLKGTTYEAILQLHFREQELYVTKK